MKNFNSIVEFADWYLQQQLGTMLCPPEKDGVMELGQKVSRFLLYRVANCQAELVLVMPGERKFEEHKHPKVDALHIYLYGDFAFTEKGVTLPYDHLGEAEGYTETIARYKSCRIKDGQSHGATVGTNGGAYLSLQYWKEVSPTSVVMDWDGEPYDDVHRKLLGRDNENE